MRANPVPPSPDEHDANELIREGRYYEQARHWYTALYIGPISERSFFLLLGCLGLLVGTLGFAAVMGLTPLTERPQVVVRNERLNDAIPSLTRLRAKGQNINEAMKTYLVKQYVISREDYHAADFTRNSNFVIAHSDPSVAANYVASVGPDNPRNPGALLGAYGTRSVALGTVTFSRVAAAQPVAAGEEAPAASATERAIVRFSTELGGSAPVGRTQWTATIDFLYSDAVVTETTDPETGEKKATFQQPTFQVVNYVLTQA